MKLNTVPLLPRFYLSVLSLSNTIQLMPFRFISMKSRSFTLFTLSWGISRDGLNIACTAFFKPGKFMACRKEYLDRLIESVDSARIREITSRVRNLLVKKETINFLATAANEVLCRASGTRGEYLVEIKPQSHLYGPAARCALRYSSLTDFASNFGRAVGNRILKNTQNQSQNPRFLLQVGLIYWNPTRHRKLKVGKG